MGVSDVQNDGLCKEGIRHISTAGWVRCRQAYARALRGRWGSRSILGPDLVRPRAQAFDDP